MAKVELLAVGLDVSWAVARRGEATPGARVIHMHAPTHMHMHTHYSRPGELQTPRHITQSKPLPFEVPLPPSGLTLARLSFSLGGELVVKYGVETCYMLA